jgi:hypothetical protein
LGRRHGDAIFFLVASGAVAILLGCAINHRLKGGGFLRFVYAGRMVVGVILFGQAVGG